MPLRILEHGQTWSIVPEPEAIWVQYPLHQLHYVLIAIWIFSFCQSDGVRCIGDLPAQSRVQAGERLINQVRCSDAYFRPGWPSIG